MMASSSKKASASKTVAARRKNVSESATPTSKEKFPQLDFKTSGNEEAVGQSSSAQTIVGYIQNVSPDQVSKKGAPYFSFYVQDRERVRKAICFSPEKRKLVESKAESRTPCKVSKYGKSINTSPGKDVLWINHNTRIDDAPDTVVNFPYQNSNAAVSTPTTIKDLKEHVKVNELITVEGLINFGSNVPEKAGSPGLTKLEGYLVDKTDCILLTVWNDNIKKVENGKTYVLEDVRLKQYQGMKYLTSTPNSKFSIKKEPLTIPPELLENAAKKLPEKYKEVKIVGVKAVEIVEYYSCVKCYKRIQSRSDSQLAKCDSCNCRFLLEYCKKSKMARVSVTSAEKSTDEWYSLFEPALVKIVEKYNGESNQEEDLTTIEEEKLSELILMSKNMTLIVNSGNNCVNTVKF